MEKQGQGGAFQVVVSGMKGIIRILLLICLVIALVFVARETYKLGYAAFNQKPIDAGEGREIKVTVTEDMSVAEIGEMLKNAGLLEEEPLVFRIQEMISDYHNKILPGTYALRTGMTADEMLRVLAQEDVKDDEETDRQNETQGAARAADR